MEYQKIIAHVNSTCFDKKGIFSEIKRDFFGRFTKY
jgi:hypothetical protein